MSDKPQGEGQEFKDDEDFLSHVVNTDANPEDVERFHRIIVWLKARVASCNKDEDSLMELMRENEALKARAEKAEAERDAYKEDLRMELAGNQKFREIVGARENEGMFSLAKRLKDRDAWKGVAEKMVKALKKTDDEVGHMTLYIVSQGGGPRKQVILREMCLYEEALSEFANMEGKK